MKLLIYTTKTNVDQLTRFYTTKTPCRRWPFAVWCNMLALTLGSCSKNALVAKSPESLFFSNLSKSWFLMVKEYCLPTEYYLLNPAIFWQSFSQNSKSGSTVTFAQTSLQQFAPSANRLLVAVVCRLAMPSLMRSVKNATVVHYDHFNTFENDPPVLFRATTL